MDHVIARLDADHERVVNELSHELAELLAIEPAGAAQGPPHITLVSYTDLDAAAAAAALAPIVRGADGPLAVRAHGYGMFTGDRASDLSLHVMVVRTRALDRLHRRTHAALGAAGACLAGNTDPDVWTPHITLLDRGLTPAKLGRAVEALAQRPHRSWTVGLTALAVTRRAPGGARRGPADRFTLALG
ncbi:MAG TPA: 2'-5' RNA ligase family protein [Acidimicrobiales bacterium]|nr:2'-5' RNA ligase family protein [Acidimicrobiales bacterium]